jgi:hypothetical protein
MARVEGRFLDGIFKDRGYENARLVEGGFGAWGRVKEGVPGSASASAQF